MHLKHGLLSALILDTHQRIASEGRQDFRAHRVDGGAIHVYYDVDDLAAASDADLPPHVYRSARRIEAVHRGTGRALVLKNTEGIQGQILDKSTEPRESR